jgi:hypothetical protein
MPLNEDQARFGLWLDASTEIRQPHEAIVERKDGKKTVRVVDPRTSVTVQEQGCALSVFFHPESGEFAEIRLTPPKTGPFEPWRLLANASLYAQYARASLAADSKDLQGAIRALQQVSSTRRGLSDDQLHLVAQLHRSLIAEGERYPIKAISRTQHVDVSTASRWVKAARDRGFLEAKETQS